MQLPHLAEKEMLPLDYAIDDRVEGGRRHRSGRRLHTQVRRLRLRFLGLLDFGSGRVAGRAIEGKRAERAAGYNGGTQEESVGTVHGPVWKLLGHVEHHVM